MKSTIFTTALVGLILSGCGRESSTHEHGHDEEHGHGEEPGHGEEHGHGHGHEGASEVVTRWGERTQLFVEFPALVAGEDSPLAAHLTRLSDHFAIDEGEVTVELACEGRPVQSFSASSPKTAGIFRPVVRPLEVGTCGVSLALQSPAASEIHDVGAFEVFANREAADAAAGPQADADGEISYLLEQQWRVPFRVGEVQARQLRPNFPAFARLTHPPDAQALVTAPREGRVVAAAGRFPKIGADFEEGDVMLQLSTAPPAGADPATLDLAIDEAVIKVESATREVDRLAPLVSQGVVPRRRLDAAESTLATAKAELRSARRRRRSLRQAGKIGGRGDVLDVPAPIHGALAEVFVSPGTWVAEGDELGRIVDRDHLLLNVGVPEAYVGRMRDVSGAWFELDGLDEVIEVPASALVSVGTEVDAQSRTLPVLFEVDNVRNDLFAGQTTQAHLISDAPKTTLAVEFDAVLEDGGERVVFVQTGGESFERRSVELGVRDKDWVEVTDGLSLGEWVVVRGAYAVKLASSPTASIGHGHAH